MDRSFLSNETVISASRDFVCIRCATYEDEKEAEFLSWIFTGRDGELQNTVFCILSPNGKEKLIRGGRGPMQFRSPELMGREMIKIASQYDFDETKNPTMLPTMKNVRLGINVAACDSLPAIVVYGENEKQLSELSEKLAPIAWNEDLLGMFIYSRSSDIDELSLINDMKKNAGFVIVEPDAFGKTAKVLEHVAADASAEEIQNAMEKAAKAFKRPIKNHHSHVRSGNQQGIQWETEIPVTDAQALRAQQRHRRK